MVPTIEKEIARDMIKWHVQPGIMEHYRRFIVVKSPRDSQKRTYEDGVSISTRDYQLPLTPTSRSNGELCGSSILRTASDPPSSITDVHTSHIILEAVLYLANQLYFNRTVCIVGFNRVLCTVQTEGSRSATRFYLC